MTETIRAIADRIQREAPARERLPLCFGPQRIDVLSNSPDLLDGLRRYFAAFDEGDREREADLVVRAHQMEPPDLGLDLPPLRTIEPQPGYLALFPSTLYHGTTPFGSAERMTVAFDVVTGDGHSGDAKGLTG